MKTLALVLIFAATSLAQDSTKVYLLSRQPDGLLKLISVPKTWLTGESFQPQATATVDSTIFMTKTALDSVKANRAYTGHTHTQENVSGLTDSVAAKPTRTELTTLLATKQASLGFNLKVQKRTADTSYNAIFPAKTIGNLQFNVTNGTYYAFQYVLGWSSAATTTGIKFKLSTPTTTVFWATVDIYGEATAAKGSVFQGFLKATTDSVTSANAVAQNTQYPVIIQGVIVPSADGTVSLQFASEIASSAVTIKNGSSLILWSAY